MVCVEPGVDVDNRAAGSPDNSWPPSGPRSSRAREDPRPMHCAKGSPGSVCVELCVEGGKS